MATLEQKVMISLGASVLMFIVNSEMVYKLTDMFSSGSLYNHATKCPTNLGLLVHTLVFFGLTYWSMGSRTKNLVKLDRTIYSTLIFYFLSSPTVYAFVSELLGGTTATSQGCPNLQGRILHALVFCAALVGIMYLPN